MVREDAGKIIFLIVFLVVFLMAMALINANISTDDVINTLQTQFNDIPSSALWLAGAAVIIQIFLLRRIDLE